MVGVREAAQKWGITERRVTMLCRNGKIIGARKEGKCWLVPENTPAPQDGRYKKHFTNEETQTASYIGNCAYDRVTNAFRGIYLKDPQNVAFTPYRICPIGAHVDHQLGEITGFAIDKGIYMAYGAKQNGIIEIKSLQFPKRAQWHVSVVPARKENDWADYLRGATIALAMKYSLKTGLCAIIDGELPIGGLASSASVIISFVSALADINNIKLTADELIEISKNAENDYVGVSCGKLDQSCEIYCRKDRLLHLDTKTDKFELVAPGQNMAPYEIAIFFSGTQTPLVLSGYNTRVDECKCAAYSLMAFANLEYGKFKETYLRDVPYDVFLKHKEKLPENFRKRAEHYYSETQRVEKAVKAWKKGDIIKFGEYVFQSGESSIEAWETGSPELIKLYEIMKKTEGIYGGRFSGTGYKGSCIAIINPEYRSKILSAIEREYIKEFPYLKGKYRAYICQIADGLKL